MPQKRRKVPGTGPGGWRSGDAMLRASAERQLRSRPHTTRSHSAFPCREAIGTQHVFAGHANAKSRPNIHPCRLQGAWQIAPLPEHVVLLLVGCVDSASEQMPRAPEEAGLFKEKGSLQTGGSRQTSGDLKMRLTRCSRPLHRLGRLQRHPPRYQVPTGKSERALAACWCFSCCRRMQSTRSNPGHPVAHPFRSQELHDPWLAKKLSHARPRSVRSNELPPPFTCGPEAARGRIESNGLPEPRPLRASDGLRRPQTACLRDRPPLASGWRADCLSPCGVSPRPLESFGSPPQPAEEPQKASSLHK